MAQSFFIASNGNFQFVDSVLVSDGSSYSFSFRLDFDTPTATGIPLSIISDDLQIGSLIFETGANVDTVEIPFGTYISGAEVFTSEFALVDADAQTVGFAGFDFYFRDGALPLDVSSSDTGESLLAEGLIVDFAPTFTIQSGPFGGALGVSDVELVPEPSTGLLIVTSLLIFLRRHRQ